MANFGALGEVSLGSSSEGEGDFQPGCCINILLFSSEWAGGDPINGSRCVSFAPLNDPSDEDGP